MLMSTPVTQVNTIPHVSVEELQTRATFLALMWALSYPGRRYSLSTEALSGWEACRVIGEALLDLETSFYTPDQKLAQALTGTAARAAEAAIAAYHFYPTVGHFLPGQPGDNFTPLKAALVGNYLYPDQSATIIVTCRLGVGETLRLSGPGIDGARQLQVAGIDSGFWAQRRQSIRYPLGWDVFLVDGPWVVGLPRTTVVDVVSGQGA